MGPIPPITFILLILALYYFITGKVKQLAYLGSISLIFQEAHIVTGLTNIQPSRLVYSIFILLTFLNMILSKERRIQFSKKYDRILIFSIYIVPASLLASIIASGDLVSPVYNTAFGATVESAIKDLVPLKLSFALITQNLFVIFTIIVFYCLRQLDKDTLEKCVKYFIYAIAFLSIWNIITAIEYLITGQSILKEITYYLIGQKRGYGVTQGFGFIRIGGFVGEPSQYSYVTLPAFGYVMGMFMIDKKRSKMWLKLAALFLVGLFISFSSSGLAGLIIFLFIYSIYNMQKKSYLRLIMLFMIFTVIIVYLERNLFDSFYKYNYAKLIGRQLSFGIRFWSIKHNLFLFFNHPLIGVGIGSTGALSGFVSSIVGFGILGAFILLFSLRNIRPTKHKGLVFALLGLFIYNIGAGDLSTFFSPIAAICFSYSSKI